jgi:hypothetical protein
MGVLKYVNVPVFIISLAVGLFFVYIYQADRKVIYVYPKPDNVDVIQYKDATGTCYQAKQEQTKCTADAETIPAQG